MTIKFPFRNRSFSGLIVFFVFLVLLLLVKHNTLHAPFHWDALGFVIQSAEAIHDHGIIINKTGSTGHPPFFLLMLALTWAVFGKGILVSHLLNIVIGALGLTFLFFFAHRLYGLLTALIATILLFFCQTFFTQVGIVYLEIAVMTAAISVVYAYVTDRYWLYFFSAVVMCLVKESALVIIVSICLYELIRKISNKEKPSALFKKLGLLSLPVIPLIIWWGIHYLAVGRIFPSRSLFINRGNYVGIFLKNLMKNLFYDYSIERYNRANWIIFIVIVAYFVFSFRRNKKSHEFLYILIILVNFALFSITDDLPRYFLIVFPFFFLLGAKAFVDLMDRFKWKYFFLVTILAVYIGFSVVNYFGTRQTDGWRLESNMEYLDMINLHVSVCKYIQRYHGSSLIMTNFPLNIALKKTWYGYVNRPMKVIKFRTLKKDEDPIVVWSAQTNFGRVVSFMHRNNHNLKKIREFSYRGKLVRIFKFAE